MTTLRKLTLIVPLLLANGAAMACEVCQKQQPKILRGIAHGGGPQSNWDYLIVWSMVAIVTVSAFYTVKWMLRPGEKECAHIKRSILNMD